MTLEELRSQVDELDRQIVALLNQRAGVALQIGQVKASSSREVYAPAREKIVYDNLRAANHGPLPDAELTHIYERIIDVMRTLQRRQRVAPAEDQVG